MEKIIFSKAKIILCSKEAYYWHYHFVQKGTINNLERRLIKCYHYRGCTGKGRSISMDLSVVGYNGDLKVVINRNQFLEI